MWLELALDAVEDLVDDKFRHEMTDWQTTEEKKGTQTA